MMRLLIPIIFHIGLLFFTLDMATDCKLMHYYYTQDEMIYFWLILFFTAGPWIFNNICLYWDKDLGCNKYIAGLMAICMVLVIYCIIRNLILIWMGKITTMNSSNKTLRMIKNVGESMPQLCIQSYIILNTLAKDNFEMDSFSLHDLVKSFKEGTLDIPIFQLVSVILSLFSITIGFVVFAFEDATMMYQFVLFVFSLICAGLRVTIVVFVATYEHAYYTWWIPPMLGFIASFLVWLVRRYCRCHPRLRSLCAIIESKGKQKFEMKQIQITASSPTEDALRNPEPMHQQLQIKASAPTLEAINNPEPMQQQLQITDSSPSEDAPRNPKPMQQQSLGALNILLWLTNLAFNWYNITGLLINLSFLGCYALYTFILDYDQDEYNRTTIAFFISLAMTAANIIMIIFYNFCICFKYCFGACCFENCCFCKGCYVEETDWLY